MKTTTLFTLGLIALIASLLVMRHDHDIATAQVTTIVHVDQTGPVPTASMTNIQHYVSSHMGSSVAFQLNGAYNRDLAAAQAANTATGNGTIYSQAQAACASIKNAVSQAQCNEQYLQSHLQPESVPKAVPEPKLSSYTYNLNAPFWTPDWAGWLMAFAVILLLATSWRLLKRR